METVRNGWLYSGDVATFDEDHYIYILDRKKNMIIRWWRERLPQRD